MRRLTRLVMATVLLSGCGTGVFTHRFEIAIADPAGRLGAPPVELSVFDPQMGRSEEWARKTACALTAAAPCVITYDTVETILGPSLRPTSRLAAALWLPAYEKAGYFQIVLEPNGNSEMTVTLPFAPWTDVYPEGAKAAPLTARVSAEDSKRGSWNLKMTILIP